MTTWLIHDRGDSDEKISSTFTGTSSRTGRSQFSMPHCTDDTSVSSFVFIVLILSFHWRRLLVTELKSFINQH